MRKQIKKYGNTHVITFSKKEMEFYDLKFKDIIDISDFILVVSKRKTK